MNGLIKYCLVILTAILTVANYGAAHSGTERGNGGGGPITKDGHATIYSAGLYKEWQTALPELEALVMFIAEAKYLTEFTKTRLLQSLLPTERRTYQILIEEEVDKIDISEIKEEYKERFVGSDIIIYATTKKMHTNIYPSFFKLKKVEERMAILLHEALWVYDREYDYTDVLKIEALFQAILEDQSNPLKVYEFVRSIGNQLDALKAAIYFDKVSKIPKSLYKLKNIFGEDYIKCKQTNLRCTATLLTHLIKLKELYPHSVLIQLIDDSIKSRKFDIVEENYLELYNYNTGGISASKTQFLTYRSLDKCYNHVLETGSIVTDFSQLTSEESLLGLLPIDYKYGIEGLLNCRAKPAPFLRLF